MKLLTSTELAEIIQAGDVLRQEVEAVAQDIEEGDPGSGLAKIMRAMAAEWNKTVERHREP